MDAVSRALTSRSLHTIQTELDFLVDTKALTKAQAAQIHELLPWAGHARDDSVRSSRTASVQSPIRENYAASASEKTLASPSPTPSPAPPPSYSAHQPSQPPPTPARGIATMSALYAYTPTDAGDLELAPNDTITVLDWTNADWARGRNQRTGAEGIFPRSYAKHVDANEKADPNPYSQPAAPWQQQQRQQYQQPSGPGSYGNMPMEVAQQPAPQPPQGDPNEQGGGKFNQQGKKFGKKLGNAAIFGAGASIGSNIVNGIL